MQIIKTIVAQATTTNDGEFRSSYENGMLIEVLVGEDNRYFIRDIGDIYEGEAVWSRHFLREIQTTDFLSL